MPSPVASTPDFRSRVASEFASRPTLRKVASEQIMQLLIEHYPLIAVHRPTLTHADQLILVTSTEDGLGSVLMPIVDVVLQAFFDCSVLDLGPVADQKRYFNLGSKHFFAIPDPSATADGDVLDLASLTGPFNELVMLLNSYFSEAQVKYWREVGSLGVSRDRWLQHTLKAALLRNMPLQALDQQQQQCVRSLLHGGEQQPSVFLVQVNLTKDGDTHSVFLPDLVVYGEWDERQTVLWCKPSGVIWAFDDFDAFALALRDEQPAAPGFDSMTWHRHELEGDPFAQQSAMLHECMLDDVSGLISMPIGSVAELEQAYHALSDPSRWFIEGYIAQNPLQVTVPPGLQSAAPADSFAYACGLFEMALAQADADAEVDLDPVLDLESYTRQQLRAQLLADHPDDANYFPDELILTVKKAWGVPGGAGAGFIGGAIEERRMALTEFAIGNLSALEEGAITAITHTNNQLIMDWLTVDYLKALVAKVDIGGTYPAYVAARMDDPEGYDARVGRFGKSWRCGLLFTALQAKLSGTLSEAALQSVSDYCGGRIDPSLPATMLMPMALARGSTQEGHDQVAGMYVLFSADPSSVLLYRPLFNAAPLLEFASLKAMMEKIRQDDDLRNSVLDWLPSEARSRYDKGWPHLGEMKMEFLPSFWRLDVDRKLYKANRDLLVELADRNTVSNAEARWATLVQGAWLLFDLVTPFIGGPVGKIAWLVQMYNVVKRDMQDLKSVSEFERSNAVVDLLLNLVLILGHVRLPKGVANATRLPVAARVEALPAGSVLIEGQASNVPEQGAIYLPGAVTGASTHLDFSFSGGQGMNVLPPERRKQVEAMRSSVDLAGHKALNEGPKAGLYDVDGQLYAQLRGDTYAVTYDTEGVRVVDRQGKPGPWLMRREGGWSIDTGQRLRGGMPRKSAQSMRESNERQIGELQAEDARLTARRNIRHAELAKYEAQNAENQAKILDLKAKELLDEQQREELGLLVKLRIAYRRRVADSLKQIIEIDTEHDALLAKLKALRPRDKVLADALVEQRGRVRYSLVSASHEYYNLLAEMINDEDVEAQRDKIAVLPESEEEKAQYALFVESLTRAERWEGELIRFANGFDTLLENTLKDLDIYFQDDSGQPVNKDRLISDIIKLRKTNAIDLEYRRLEDLAEASLNRLQGSSEEQLEEYESILRGKTLQSIGASHGDLASIISSETERVAMLADILDVYEETAGRAEYLASLDSPAIRADRLKDYLEVLKRLKALAVEDMHASMRELESTDAAPVRTPVYAPRGGARRVVRPQRGRSVIGVEHTDADGEAVIEQKNSHDKVLRTFRRHNGQWQEVDAPAEQQPEAESNVPSPPVAAVRTRARKLLANVDASVAMARQFFASGEPLGLSTVLEQHIKDLQTCLKSLPRTATDDDLIGKLERAITELQDNKAELLKTLYLTTRTPTANALQFLHDAGELKVARTQRRAPLGDNDFLDVYEIRRSNGKALWEAHFHYAAEQALDRDFVRGHLKLWSQRRLGQKAEASALRKNEVLKVYRGQLRKDDVEGIIPFE